MARLKEFDEQDALRAAMKLFWSKGYEGTTLTELLHATGLSKSSLYATFGNKRALFLKALSLYQQERMRALTNYLSAEETAFAALRCFFDMVLHHAGLEERPFGCMSCNEAVELGPHDAEVQALVERDFLAMEDAFATAIDRGKKDKSITTQQETRSLARFLVITHQGVQLMARSKAHPDQLKDALAVMLGTLQETAK